MKELTDVERLFVEEQLDQHGEYVMDQLADAIVEKKTRVTDALLESLDYRVEKRADGFVLSIGFLTYGRFMEIAYYKSRALRRERVKNNDIKAIRRSKKKDTRIYARIVYGTINRLLGRMSSEYSDMEIERLKGILEGRR